MDNAARQKAFYALQDLRGLWRSWNATSHEVKLEIVEQAIVALEAVPLPDDLAEDEAA